MVVKPTRHYKKRWGKHFSTVEIGKTMLYNELENHGKIIKYAGWQTAISPLRAVVNSEARKYWGIKKSSAKDALTPESHANDALAMSCCFDKPFRKFLSKQQKNA
jgi:hypothetical protein